MGVKFDKFYGAWRFEYKDKNGRYHVGHEQTKENAKKAFEATKKHMEEMDKE